MTSKPTITPFSAKLRLKNGEKDFKEGDFIYYIDGPMMSPGEYHFPVAINDKEGTSFFPFGAVEDEITEGTFWYQGEGS